MSEFKVFTSELLGEKYYKAKHKSGLDVYVFPKDMSTTYGLLSVNFGGRVTEYEKNGEKTVLPEGCAHFLEHKLFDNSDGTNADDVFSSLGAYCNAYTSTAKTTYYFSTTENEEKCLEHLIHFVTDPYFTEETVNKEIGIIAQEINGCIDDPYDRNYIDTLESMYHNDPAKREICGSVESISKITADTLYKCCQDFYVPSNMLLCVSGKTTPEKVMEIVDKALSECESETPKIQTFEEPKNVLRPYFEREMQVGKPLFTIGVKDINIPVDPMERFKRAETINILLNVMFSEASDFYLEMLDKGLISPGFDAGYSISPTTAFTMITGDSDEPERLFSEIKKYIQQCLDRGLDKRDFDREKKCMYASYISSFDLTEDIAFSLLSYGWDGIDLFSYSEMIRSIEYSDIVAILHEIFNDEYFTMSVVRPQRRKE